MKKRILTLTVMSAMALGALAFSSSTPSKDITLICTSGDTGVCVDVLEGKACHRLKPEYIGDCGGTSAEEVNPE